MHEDPVYTSVPIKIIDESFPSPNEDFLGWFSCILESLLGKHKYAGYKNRVSGNLRIIAAIQVVTLCTLLSLLPTLFLLKNSVTKLQEKDFVTLVVTLVITYIGAVGGLFWKEKHSLYSKWEYLAGLYNEVIKLPKYGPDTYPKREILNVSLAMDILQMEMWAHESFCDTFRGVLESAIRDHAHKLSAEFMISHLDKSGISRRDAMAYLLKYQIRLLEMGGEKAG